MKEAKIKTYPIYIWTTVFAALFGCAFWVAAGIFEYFFFHRNLRFLLLEGPETLLDSIILKVPPQAIFSRVCFIIACLSGGLLVAIYLRRSRLAERELRALNVELESRVAERTVQLEAINKELEAFAYSVSHDLRAPLRAIREFSQIILEDHYVLLDAEAGDYFRRIVAAAMRMDNLIDELLELSGLSHGTMHREPVDLSQAAAEIMQDLRKREPDRKVMVRIEPGLTVNGDHRLLRVLLENLLGNAWKFSARKSIAEIEFRTADRHRKGEEDPGGKKTFVVRDNGVGFDSAYADKLFAPFKRLHSSKDFEGNGIGLATVRRVVLRHGGRVWAEGCVGAGACFYFEL